MSLYKFIDLRKKLQGIISLSKHYIEIDHQSRNNNFSIKEQIKKSDYYCFHHPWTGHRLSGSGSHDNLFFALISVFPSSDLFRRSLLKLNTLPRNPTTPSLLFPRPFCLMDSDSLWYLGMTPKSAELASSDSRRQLLDLPTLLEKEWSRKLLLDSINSVFYFLSDVFFFPLVNCLRVFWFWCGVVFYGFGCPKTKKVSPLGSSVHGSRPINSKF